MAKILLGWQFGSGMGHVAKLVAIAKALKAAGHKPVMALIDPVTSTPKIADAGIPVLPAPLWRAPPEITEQNKVPKTMADILINYGLHDPDVLSYNVGAWQPILDATKPQLIICDACPALMMATFGRIPTVVVGSGYLIPPPGMAMPPSRFWEDSAPPESIDNEFQIYQSVRQVRLSLGLPMPEFLADLYNADDSFVCALPELDPYARYRKTPQVGPLDPSGDQILQLWSSGWTPKGTAFAYLSALNSDLSSEIGGLSSSKIPFKAFIRHLSETRKNQLAEQGIKLFDWPPALSKIAPLLPAIIHHGGLSTSHLALYAGIPQFLLPNHLEQVINSKALSDMGLAFALSRMRRQDNPDIIREQFQRFAATPSLVTNAQLLAATLRERGLPNPMEIILQRCLELIG